MDEIARLLPAGRQSAVEAAAADAAQAGARVRRRRGAGDAESRSISTTRGSRNTGTWFLGRLQTERDKARVLDGLEGAAQAGVRSRRRSIARCRRSPKRVFLMHNVHESEPVVFETRWTLSYLRGPLSRDQIKRLADGTDRAAAPRAGRNRRSATASREPQGAAASVRSCRRASRSVFLRAPAARPAAVYAGRCSGPRASASRIGRLASTRRRRALRRAGHRRCDSGGLGTGRTARGAASTIWSDSPTRSAAFAPLPAVGAAAEEIRRRGRSRSARGWRRTRNASSCCVTRARHHVTTRRNGARLPDPAPARRPRARATRRSRQCGRSTRRSRRR